MKILCIDGNSVLNRSFYAIKLLTTKDGRYTNAICGFLNVLIKLRAQYIPDAVAVAFDLPDKTFRHERYDKYKATRKGMPQELAQQLPVLKDLLGFLGYAVVTAKGFEADDILGTLAQNCGEGNICYIATGDRDALQLINENVKVLLTTTQAGRGETHEMNVNSVREKYGLNPKQLIELKGLMGDASDNIPGVPGIGEKTAVPLIRQFGDMDGLYANLHSESIRDSVRQKLEENKEIAYLSRELATICKDVPIVSDPVFYVPKEVNQHAAAMLLGELEMHSYISKIGLNVTAAQDTEDSAVLLPDIGLQMSAPAEAEKIYLYGNEQGNYAVTGTHGYKLDDIQLRGILASHGGIYCYDSKRFYHAAQAGGYRVKNIRFDLKIAAYLLNPLSGDYNLGNVAQEYHVSAIFSNSEVPDLGLLEPLCETLKRRLEEEGMLKLHDEVELPLAKVLAEMESTGFLLDVAELSAFGEDLRHKTLQEQVKIYELVGTEFNLNSPKQLGKILFEDLGLPAGKKIKSGYSTNAETLEKLHGVHPAIGHILQHRVYQKLNSTYVDGLKRSVDHGGRVHTEFHQTETRTGRISSREPNLQNIPVRTELGSQFRNFFIAPDGKVLVDADYSQIELRVLASLSNDERMLEAFRSGQDIHTDTAREIFKVPLEQVTPELRRRAKAVNFGIVYGIGAFSLAEDIGVSMQEASDYIRRYLATYGGVADYLEKTVADAKRQGYVTTLYGRKRVLPEIMSSNKQVEALGKRLAMNTPIQGTAADIIKIAMVKVSKRLTEENLQAKMILQVHDELILECDLAEAERTRSILKEEMEKAAQFPILLEVDVGIGRTWYNAK